MSTSDLVSLVGGRYGLLIAAVIVAATVVMVSAITGTSSAFTPTVSINCSDGSIFVYVELPGPRYYEYTYVGYEYTYTYVSPVSTRVIVMVEDYSDPGAPQPVRGMVVGLEAYGPNNKAEFNFTVTSGVYRVKVLFWNGLLSELSVAGREWVPLSDPVVEVCTLP